MLGKLFNLGGAVAGTGPPAQTPSHKPISSLESVQEDIHTRNLLFPDPQDLYEHRLNQVFPLSSASSIAAASSTNAFDYSGDIELDLRDVRIIVMQDALSSVAASLLYDSQTPPPAPTAAAERPSTTAGSASHYSVQDARRAPASPRKPSVSHAQRPIIIQPDSPKIRQGAFDRRPSVHARNQGYTETDSQRTWREYREELTTFSSCIFGNSELMAYKGTSTKVHVVPSESRPTDNASILGDGRGSIGRSSMRSSRLSQSFSSENIPPTPTMPSRAVDRKKVLVTRLFPVSLPIEEDVLSPPHGPSVEDNGGYPFPQSSEELKMRKRKNQPKQKRTPMYAVALVINLPPVSSHSTPAATLRSGFRGPGSYSEQDSFPSSFNSNRPSGWTMVGQGAAGLDSFETSFGSDAEDQIDAITQHWDIIMRALNRLQSVVAATLFTMLKQADMVSPDPMPPSLSVHNARALSMSGRRSDELPPMKPPKSNAKHITLLPNCLQDNRHIAAEADVAKSRIVAGIRATRVTTGQNRWPIWREEARWVAKWAGGREQGFFFFNLLTGFLATHTDWLQALSPASYRRRFYLQQKGKLEEDTSVPSRTIIISQDKIAARRLIFLLSAFLPASQQLSTIRPHRPSTPASLGTLSHSPPSFVVPILKEESLRRKINRRTGPRRTSHSRNLSMQSQQGRASAVPLPLAHLSMEGRHERRPSDAASIRTTQLPIRGSDPTTRKSSAATTATITPETSIPHFSSIHRPDLFSSGRPGSSNSMAADDLKRLTRDDTTGVAGEPRQHSRWGSVISGLWPARRRDSGAASIKGQTSGDGRPVEPASPMKPQFGSGSQAVKRATGGDAPGPSGEPEASRDQPSSPGGGAKTDRSSSDNQAIAEPTDAPPKVQRTPNPSGAFESPVKTSINVNDGVIDVDVPFPDYITSFETAVSSPSSSGYLSTPGFGTGFDTFEQSCRVAVDGDTPVNVAGWLQHYHPDFVLQALPSQEGIIDQIKASMQAEPSPTWLPNVGPSDRDSERWVDVSTALVADTTTFSITRIRYRRLVRLKPVSDRLAPVAVGSYSSAVLTPTSASPYEIHLKEEFREEPVFELDDVLVDAVERVVAMGADLSKGGSGASSRSTSKRRERRDSISTQSDAHAVSHLQGQDGQSLSASLGAAAGIQEVPRSQCKAVLLSALEEVIREVIEEREIQREGGDQDFGEYSEPGRHAALVRGRVMDTILREAVRGWLESVDFGGE
ncbi:folliculin-interacting protein N-terminus-domain-containing protein [Podospora aff. communis PSN243]|uniref:Folliculin-interacting protein N-terminus-domain-containing protein n=1 Tax=Podospora aff. communis PSN243 TaxID=3040156 RepID=A0AAV9H5P6_9PEZI|nr:folliculin-interacting protein N-terminus-domain-containing protein [Podospora aff. communis PSN243]